MKLSHDAKVYLLETSDIGGTTAATSWVQMGGLYNEAYAYVEIGTFNATDTLDQCRIEAAEDSSGTNSEEVTTDASGGDYDTDNAVGSDGDFVILEIEAENLPVGKNFVRLIIGEDDNSGTDNATAFLMLHGAVNKAEEKQGAASAGSQVYVSPYS